MPTLLPNFLIIGAARCGTSSLYELLQVHPDVFLPSEKRPEPHFFLRDHEFARGLTYYETRYFSSHAQEKAVGEASTSYIFDSRVPERVARSLPSVKLVLMLRNPVERAFSNYWHSVNCGFEKLSFEEAILAEDRRVEECLSNGLQDIQPYAYASRSDYYPQITRWLSWHNRQAMHFMLFEELVAHREGLLEDVARFLGITTDGFNHAKLPHSNSATPPGSKITDTALGELRRKLDPGIKQLATLLNKDLSDWLMHP